MATDKEFLSFVLDQIESGGQITAKKMFGEYAVYSDGKLFGLICDNRLFIKITESGRKFFKHPLEKPPYPGAKSAFLIEDQIEDRQWLTELVKKTVEELPFPKQKKRKSSM